MDFIHEEEKDLKNIFNRFRKRDFSGTGGQVIKNSSYQLTTNIVAKFGSLIFTALIARMLLPELFGLYSLALGTIIFFAAFSDLGLDAAMITFISKFLGKKKFQKAKNYFSFLVRLKVSLILIVSLVLVVSAYFVANFYYHKPIFFALLSGGLYLPFATFSRFIETLFTANNNFKFPMFKEIIFQAIRFLIIPLSIFFLFKTAISEELLIAALILGLSFCYFASLIYLWFKARKTMPFLRVQRNKLGIKEKIRIRNFTLPLTATVLSGVFFGYIDTLMLGRFVSSEFIGYYGIAFSLIASAITLLGFMGVALFPIFSRSGGKNLDRIFKKMLNVSLLISIFGAIFTFFLAKYIIIVIYGNHYIPAVLFLKYFSVLLIIGTLTGLHSSYFLSQEKTKIFAYLLLGTTVLNIILNYVLITNGLKTGMEEAVVGACTATVISRFVYLGGLVYFRRKG